MGFRVLSEEYTVCRCGAKFTNDAEGKRLYDLHNLGVGSREASVRNPKNADLGTHAEKNEGPLKLTRIWGSLPQIGLQERRLPAYRGRVVDDFPLP